MIKSKKLNKLFSILIVILVILNFIPLKAGFVFAEVSADLNTQEQEAEAKLKELEVKISQYRDAIGQNQQKAKSLKTEIAILDDEIESAQLESKGQTC